MNPSDHESLVLCFEDVLPYGLRRGALINLVLSSLSQKLVSIFIFIFCRSEPVCIWVLF